MLTFERIKKCDLHIPPNLPEDAKDFITRLLRVNPRERLGANCNFSELKGHPFFKGIVFDKLWEQTPPEIKPFPYELDFSSENASDGNSPVPNSANSSSDVTHTSENAKEEDEETQRVNKIKADTEKWRDFIRSGESVIESGVVRSKKLRGRDAILLLTDTPRLVYVNPKKMVVKKEKAWTLSFSFGMIKAPDSFFLMVNKKKHKYKACDQDATKWLKAFEEAVKIHKSGAVPQEE